MNFSQYGGIRGTINYIDIGTVLVFRRFTGDVPSTGQWWAVSGYGVTGKDRRTSAEYNYTN